MSSRNSFLRSLHDLGLAAWFGGSLAGAVGINGAASDVPDRAMRLQVANAGWARWSPVNLAAIGAHLVGATGIAVANTGRVAGQKGVGATTLAKAGLTGAALAVTAWSGALGSRLAKHGPTPVQGGTEPAQETPDDVARAQQQLKIAQWLVPGLTAGVAVLNAVHGEQQRPFQQVRGFAQRAGRLVQAVG